MREPHARAADGRGKVHRRFEIVQVRAPAGQGGNLVGVRARQPQGLEGGRQHHGRFQSRALQGIANAHVVVGDGRLDGHAPRRVELQSRDAVRPGERHGLVQVVADLVDHEAVGEGVLGMAAGLHVA